VKLITKSLAKKLSAASLESTEPICKLFVPWGLGTEWLLTCEKKGLLYGFVDLKMGCVEWGCVGTEESLKAIRGPLGLGIERDRHWRPSGKVCLSSGKTSP
jgi:Protein of unknown function (DUF2958)